MIARTSQLRGLRQLKTSRKVAAFLNRHQAELVGIPAFLTVVLFAIGLGKV